MAAILTENLVFFEILRRLPVKSLIRFKCVSKDWMRCISDNRAFIDAHRKLQQPSAIILYNGLTDNYVLPPEDFEPAPPDLEPEELELEPSDLDPEEFELEPSDLDPEDFELPPPPQKVVVCSEQFSKSKEVDLSYLIKEYGPITFNGSCEGLVCLTIGEFSERVVLWNPATRQHRLLPSPTDGSRLWGAGIGLDEASGNWKVVRLCLESDDPSTESPAESFVRAHVLTKSSTVWRDCGVSGIKGHFYYRGVAPVGAVGALHWDFYPGPQRDGDKLAILSFDLTDEVFRFANGPDPESFELCSWRSSLAALTYPRNYPSTGPIILTRPNSLPPTPTILSVASPSSCGGGLSWIKLVEFNFGVSFVWKEHYLSRKFNIPCTLLLVDPKAPEEARNLKQHICADNPSFSVCDYVESIISIF